MPKNKSGETSQFNLQQEKLISQEEKELGKALLTALMFEIAGKNAGYQRREQK
ncbi:MAG: hypothetical protein F6K10_31590 [Moorea sp. SIO2B7]|nr:hypothetical protein [Moorena sp. SIO2B7]